MFDERSHFLALWVFWDAQLKVFFLATEQDICTVFHFLYRGNKRVYSRGTHRSRGLADGPQPKPYVHVSVLQTATLGCKSIQVSWISIKHPVILRRLNSPLMKDFLHNSFLHPPPPHKNGTAHFFNPTETLSGKAIKHVKSYIQQKRPSCSAYFRFPIVLTYDCYRRAV